MLVGIFSFNKYSLYMNYGAALHSFAFQKILDALKVDNYIVDYVPKHISGKNLDNLFLSTFKVKSSVKEKIYWLVNYRTIKRKKEKFFGFFNSKCRFYANSGKPFEYKNFLDSEVSLPFDTVICESDVVWSPKTSKGFDRVLFFDFECFNNMKRIAYAPSISNTILSFEQEKEFIKLIENYDFVSSREDETAQYVEKISNRKCVCVLDPVLLLNEKDYLPYCDEIKYKNYILVYNCMKNDRNMLREAQRIGKEKKMKVIELSDFFNNKILFRHKVLTGKGIEFFLGLFSNARYIITNGFHGMCFSVIFKKQFIIFERDNYDIKNKSLLRLLGLENRFVLSGKRIDNIDIKIDYDEVYKLLDDQRQVSLAFLKESLEESF